MDSSNPFASLLAAVEHTAKIKNAEQKINDMIECIFGITINKSSSTKQPLVYMECLASIHPATSRLNMTIFEQALFERLLLDEPRHFVIPNNASISDADDMFSAKVMIYLYRVYERLMRWKQCDASLSAECDVLQELIIRNASTAMKQPMIYGNQSMAEQWIAIFRGHDSDDIENKTKFLSYIVTDIYSDDASDMDAVQSIFTQIFTEFTSIAKRSSLDTLEMWLIPAINCFVADKTNAHLARLLLQYITPKPAPGSTVINGIAYAETLLGTLVSMSLLPKTRQGEYEYFENASDRQSSTYTNLLYSRLTTHLDQLHTIFKGFLLVGGEVRTQMLDWIGACLHANQKRGQIWASQNQLQVQTTAPDSFMFGLCGILLRLCKPLIRPTFKVLDVDPTYCAVIDAERKAKGVHMEAMDKETCLISLADESEQRRTSASYNFVTEVFYLTHKSVDLSYRIGIENFAHTSREMQRVQDMYRQMMGEDSQQWQHMMNSMEREMKKVLCLQKLLTEPNNDQLLLQFFEATSHWLTKCASLVTDPSGKEIAAAEFKLPIETPAPKCLASIPECILENIVVYLTFVRHFPDLNIETDIDAQNAIFSIILVFMGDVTRVRNPHLRARLAEGMETLLPRKSTSMFGSSSRSQVFQRHPHRLDIVRNVLNVFVAIEMTGQNVQFEQKVRKRNLICLIRTVIELQIKNESKLTNLFSFIVFF